MPEECIKPPTTPTNSLSPALIYISTKILATFNGNGFKQDKLIFNHKTSKYLYFVRDKFVAIYAEC